MLTALLFFSFAKYMLIIMIVQQRVQQDNLCYIMLW